MEYFGDGLLCPLPAVTGGQLPPLTPPLSYATGSGVWTGWRQRAERRPRLMDDVAADLLTDSD